MLIQQNHGLPDAIPGYYKRLNYIQRVASDCGYTEDDWPRTEPYRESEFLKVL